MIIVFGLNDLINSNFYMKNMLENAKDNFIICNPEKMDTVKAVFQEGGARHVQVFTDFDRTLTKVFSNGAEHPSLISVLSRDGYLDEEYCREAEDLYHHYRSVEIDENIGYGKKNELMEEWWHKHYELLKRKRLNISDVRAVIESGVVQPREGFLDFLNSLQADNIPLVILSASGLGSDSIRLFFEKNNFSNENVFIVSNNLSWDNEGYFMGVAGPVIHSLNKKNIMIEKFPFYNIVKDRKNVLLLGDSLEDADMAEDFDDQNIIRIGFLNNEVESRIEEYSRRFDALVLHDGTFDKVNQILAEILKK